MAVGSVMNHAALQEAADLIETFISDQHQAAGPRTWTSAEGEAWYRLCAAHDAITQADALLGPHGPGPTPPPPDPAVAETEQEVNEESA